MNAHEWIEKSKSTIIKKSQAQRPFGLLKDELKELQLELTYACNLKCRMCDIWGKYKKNPSLPRREMSVEELIGYISESKLLKNIELAVISGGEPFLKKGIVDLIGYFVQDMNAKVGILSNLFNTELTIASLKAVDKKCGLDKLWIGTSLDGLESCHDNTRGVPGSFKNFNRTLAHIRSNFENFSVTVNFTLTTSNYKDLYAAYDFCKKNNLSVSVQFPVAWADAEKFVFTDEMMASIEAQLLHMIEDEIKDFEAGKIDENGLMVKIFYLSGMLEYKKKPCRFFKKCAMGRKITIFSPEGKVYFCPILKSKEIGYLRDKPFDEIWTSKEAKLARQKIDKGACHCWLNCTIYPNASEALYGDLSCKKSRQNLLQKLLGGKK